MKKQILILSLLIAVAPVHAADTNNKLTADAETKNSSPTLLRTLGRTTLGTLSGIGIGAMIANICVSGRTCKSPWCKNGKPKNLALFLTAIGALTGGGIGAAASI